MCQAVPGSYSDLQCPSSPPCNTMQFALLGNGNYPKGLDEQSELLNTEFMKEITSLFLQCILSRMLGTARMALSYTIICKMERQKVGIHKAYYCDVDLSMGQILNGKGVLL